MTKNQANLQSSLTGNRSAQNFLNFLANPWNDAIRIQRMTTGEQNKVDVVRMAIAVFLGGNGGPIRNQKVTF